jgi:soluble lytic murein transglycosylase-like protein
VLTESAPRKAIESNDPPIGQRSRSLLASVVLVLALAPGAAQSGAQRYEPLSDAVRAALASALSDRSPPEPRFASATERVDWLAEMSERLPARHKPTLRERTEFLRMVRYEAQRAGLDPQLVLGLIQVESGFRRHAISSAGARGYMQVMPFWTRVIGDGDPSALFDTRTNLRYGCVILRHYLDLERGDLFRALGRYNGSLGRSEYPNAVLAAWRRWSYEGPAPERVRQVAAPAPIASADAAESAEPGTPTASLR